MEPVTLIVSALVAAVAKLAEPAVNDAYNGLKTLIKQRFAGNAKVEGALEGLEEDPATWRKPLETALAQTDVQQDKEIIAAAETLQKVAGHETGKVVVSGNRQEGGEGNIQQNIGQAENSTIKGSDRQ